ncbi:MAG: hypothetical protein ACFCVG_10440 [Kineosporiaceae bacterium]
MRIQLHDDGGPEWRSVERVTTPVRVGPEAYRSIVKDCGESIVKDCGERAEMAFDRVDDNGDQYTHGWSVLVTEDAPAGDPGAGARVRRGLSAAGGDRGRVRGLRRRLAA